MKGDGDALIKRGDFILICALAVGAAAFGARHLLAPRPATGPAVVVTQTKDGFRRVDPIDSETTFTVKTPGTGSGADAAGGENTVRITHGEVRVLRANCANQVCVDHDPIREPGEQIVCLPHGMVVEVVGRESDATALD